MDILVTGSSGFVGSALRRQLTSISFDINNRPVEIRDRDEVLQALKILRPSAVIHLAAQSWVPQSFKDPVETYEINFMGTFNLLCALKEIKFRGRFLFVSSSDIYGQLAPEELPVTETHPTRPRSPYAVSKVAAEALCFQWGQTDDSIEIVVARPFVHIGPGQSDRFVISSFAKQITEIKKKQRPAVIEVGDVEVTRDFTDVRDVVRAYELLLARANPGEVYNICSAKERSVRSLLEELLALSGVSAEIKIDPQRLRTSEQRRVVGSYAKLEKQTGWTPRIGITESLQSVLNYWGGIL